MMLLVEMTGRGVINRHPRPDTGDVQVELAGGAGCDAAKYAGVGGKRQRHLRKVVNSHSKAVASTS